MNLIKENEKYLKSVIEGLGFNVEKVTLGVSQRPEFGQFQINEAFSIAKEAHKNPREIAELIVKNLDNRFTNINIQGPGFINLSFSDEYLIEYLNKGINDFDYFIDKHQNKDVIVDYGGANAAKALHVGHMRSANIGEAVKRLLKALGYNVMGDVHLGDLGRQAGMLISEYKRMNPDSVFFKEDYEGEYPKIELTPKDLGIMYPKASLEAQNNEERMNEVREITALIDKGHKAYTELWKQMVEISSVVIKDVYNRLNCHFELWEGELDAFKYIPQTLEVMKDYLYESDGALVCDVIKESDNKPMPPMMVIKKDGATIYGTRDLGTIYSRMERFNPNEMWYFTDDRQSQYFEQVFRASYKTGLVKEDTVLKHFGFGTVNGSDGKPYKTRDGGVMELGTLIDLIKEEILKKIKEDITGSEREDIAEKLAIASLKYADLLPYRKTDYIFDIEKFSSFDGKTGPYILYTAVRIKSLFKKLNYNENLIKVIPNNEIRDILVKLTSINKVLNNSYNEASLNYIAEFLYEICSLYNKFYNNYNISNENDLDIKDSYLAVSKLVYNVIHNLLDILAINEVDRM